MTYNLYMCYIVFIILIINIIVEFILEYRKTVMISLYFKKLKIKLQIEWIDLVRSHSIGTDFGVFLILFERN